MDDFLISFVAALYKKEAVYAALAGSIAAAVKVLVCAESNNEWCKAHFRFFVAAVPAPRPKRLTTEAT
jgi:hypothetical protein